MALSQAEIPQQVGSGAAPLANLEADDPTASLDQMVRALLALGTSHRELGRIIAGHRDTP